MKDEDKTEVPARIPDLTEPATLAELINEFAKNLHSGNRDELIQDYAKALFHRAANLP